MHNKSRNDMAQYYSDLLHKYGPEKESLVYCSEKQKTARYSLMSAVEPLHSKSSILDVGCGLGYFCNYLRKFGWQGKYTGIDVCADMVRVAQQRLPADNFLCLDILDNHFIDKFDYVFCCATLEHRPTHDDPLIYFEQMLRKMFELTQKALVFDLFTTRVDYLDDNKLYIDISHLLHLCYGLTNRLTMRNDCRPYEVMMYLYKEATRDSLNIYSAYQELTPNIIEA